MRSFMGFGLNVHTTSDFDQMPSTLHPFSLLAAGGRMNVKIGVRVEPSLKLEIQLLEALPSARTGKRRLHT